MKRRIVRQEYRLGIGASSLLMILVVLCLTTLGILSLTSADADLKLSRRAAEMTGKYYEAEEKLQRAISVIDAAVKNSATSKFGVDSLDEEALGISYSDLAGDRLTLGFDAGGGRILEAELLLTGERGCEMIRHVIKEETVLEEDGYLSLLA